MKGGLASRLLSVILGDEHLVGIRRGRFGCPAAGAIARVHRHFAGHACAHPDSGDTIEIATAQ